MLKIAWNMKKHQKIEKKFFWLKMKKYFKIFQTLTFFKHNQNFKQENLVKSKKCPVPKIFLILETNYGTFSLGWAVSYRYAPFCPFFETSSSGGFWARKWTTNLKNPYRRACCFNMDENWNFEIWAGASVYRPWADLTGALTTFDAVGDGCACTITIVNSTA